MNPHRKCNKAYLQSLHHCDAHKIKTFDKSSSKSLFIIRRHNDTSAHGYIYDSGIHCKLPNTKCMRKVDYFMVYESLMYHKKKKQLRTEPKPIFVVVSFATNGNRNWNIFNERTEINMGFSSVVCWCILWSRMRFAFFSRLASYFSTIGLVFLF